VLLADLLVILITGSFLQYNVVFSLLLAVAFHKWRKRMGCNAKQGHQLFWEEQNLHPAQIIFLGGAGEVCRRAGRGPDVLANENSALDSCSISTQKTHYV
jgi:hypothetical protein